MPGYPDILDPAALHRLRALVQQLHGQSGPSVPHETLVALSRDVGLEAGVTIDLRATRELGQAMVVLRVPSSPRPAACIQALSAREREVVELVAEGLSNKQIARRLFISLATVKDHVHRMLEKTGLSNRAALAAAAGGRPSGKASA